MKKLILLVVCIFTANTAFSQTVNDVPLSDIPGKYVQIMGYGKMFSNKLTIQLDFGQKDNMWSSKEHEVKDKEGNKLEFNSMVGVLNFMAANGYEFVNAYTVGQGGKMVYVYIMKKV